jgi:hypothetical protein
MQIRVRPTAVSGCWADLESSINTIPFNVFARGSRGSRRNMMFWAPYFGRLCDRCDSKYRGNERQDNENFLHGCRLLSMSHPAASPFHLPLSDSPFSKVTFPPCSAPLS